MVYVRNVHLTIMMIVNLTFIEIFNSYFPNEMKDYYTWSEKNTREFVKLLEGNDFIKVEHIPVPP
ncbi:hypothetical protein COK15_21175 [Bacillus cereus]|nr:hypothetical protein COK15_21175 [Bacillus cereus]